MTPSLLAVAALASLLFQSQASWTGTTAASPAASPVASPATSPAEGLAASPAAGPATVAAPATPTPEIVKPIAELERLQFAAGDWVHDKEVDHGGTVGMPRFGAGRSKATWILKGQALHVLYKSKRADADYEGRGIVGWDPESKRYRLDWFDSLGVARRFVGEFDPAGALVFSATSSRNGQPVKQQVTIKKDRNGRFLILDERAIGNEPSTLYMESLAGPAPSAPKAASPAPEASPAATKPPTSR